MEAIEFLKEAYRFCSQYPICSADCPLRRKCIFDFCSYDETQKETEQKIENAVAIIEQWSKEHPLVTNAQKFKEVFGLEPESDRCPPFATNDYCTGRKCIDCKSWWDEPYKEPEHEL